MWGFFWFSIALLAIAVTLHFPRTVFGSIAGLIMAGMVGDTYGKESFWTALFLYGFFWWLYVVQFYKEEEDE